MSIFGKPFLTGVGKGSASGAVASFTDGAKGLPLKSLLVDIDPVQDLHGYENPWPAGGGKNKLPPLVSQTINGVTISVASDGTTSLNGTVIGSAAIDLYIDCVLPRASYVISMNNQLTIDGSYQNTFFEVLDSENSRAIAALFRDANKSSAFTSDVSKVHYRFQPNVVLSNFIIKPQIEYGSTVTPYVPYSNICPISGWSAVNVWRTGKNLFDITKMIGGILDLDGTINGAAFVTISEQTKDTITWSQSTTWKAITSEYIPVTEGTTLFISLDEASTISYVILCWYDINKNFISRELYRGNNLQAKTAPNGAKYVRYSFQQENIGTYTYHNIMLNIGSTATPYEPYSGNQYTIQLGQTVYGGTLDVTNGVLTVDRAMVDMGTLDWIYSSEYNFFQTSIVQKANGLNNAICSAYKYGGWWTGWTNKDYVWCGNLNNTNITIKDTRYTDAAAFTTAMSGVQLVYELATPIIIQLTPQEITTLLGQNNIWADTGDVDVEYLKQTLMHIGSTIRPPHYGCVWDQEHAQMRRTGLARTITTNTQNFKHSGSVNPNYDNPFDNIYPWSERKLCNISLTLYQALQPGDNIKDCVTYWETDDGFSYNDPDGVWVYTPEFWGTSYWIGSQRYFEVSPVELAEYHHYKEQITARWRGTTESRTIGGTSKTVLLSKPGLPIANTALSTIHTYAKNGGMTLDSVHTLDASLLLYLVEYANYNAQSSIGNGVIDLYDQTTLHPDAAVTAGTTVQFTGLTSAQLADFIVGAIVDFGTASGGAQTARTYITAVETASGVTTVTLADAVTITTDTFVSIHGRINYADADIGSMSGYIGTNSKSDAYYRGEALWGNMFFYTLGAYKSDTEHVWLAEEGTEDNYDAIDTSVHTDTGIVLESAINYIKKLSWPDSLGTLFACALCTEVGGTSANPVGDYFYTTTGSSRVLVVGGYASGGVSDGPFYWYWRTAASSSGWYSAGRPRLKSP